MTGSSVVVVPAMVVGARVVAVVVSGGSVVVSASTTMAMAVVVVSGIVVVVSTAVVVVASSDLKIKTGWESKKKNKKYLFMIYLGDGTDTKVHRKKSRYKLRLFCLGFHVEVLIVCVRDSRLKNRPH